MIRQAFNRITAGTLAANYARGVLWLFADKGFKFLAELLVGFYLARHLGSDQFGVLNFAISFVIMFHGLSTLGINEVLVREVVNNREDEKRIVGTALILRLAATAGIILLVQGLASTLDSTARLLIAVLSLSLLFRAFEVFTPYFQSIVKGEVVAFIQMIVTLVGAVLKVAFIVLDKNLTWFAWVYTIEWVVLAIGLIILYLRIHRNTIWQFSLQWSRRLLRSSWYLMLSAATVNLYMRLDQVMIRQMVGDSANGHYAAAVRLSELWYIVPTILCSILFPAVINAKKSDFQLYTHRLLMLNTVLVWPALAIACIVSPFSDELVILLYGQEYAASGAILSYHIWTAPFVFFGVCSGYWLVAENNEKFTLYRTAAGLVVNVVLNFLLIPRYGAIGAAVGTLISQMAVSILWMSLSSTTRPIVAIQLKSLVFPLERSMQFLRTKYAR